MTQLGYAVLGLVLGAALGAVVLGTWRRAASTPSTRVEARLEVQAAELRRLADAAAAREGFRRSIRGGVRIACGTDAGTPFNPHGNTLVEIVRMVEWGMTPLQAMRSATSNAAALLRLADVGVVAEGAEADLVLFGSNPLEDIRAVLEPALVIKGGELVARPSP